MNVMDAHQDTTEHFLAHTEVAQVGPTVAVGTGGASATLFDNSRIISKTGITQV